MSFLLFVLAIVFFVLWKKSQKAAKEQAQKDASELANAKEEIGDLINKVVNIESKYKTLKSEEDARAAKAAETQRAADKALANAEAKAADAIAIASETADSIVADAEAKAKEIAGDAYEAKQQADTLRDTIVSLKNTINGYGDEWLKPTYTLLDELAEEFGYTEAGQNLDKARRKTALLIRYGRAGICEYAESNGEKTPSGKLGSIFSLVRKPEPEKSKNENDGASEEELNKIAVNFIVDAFNGKVDSILSRTKKDNFGKLEREIKDAYNLVNMNGEACRGARITEDYLKSRLEELRWAVVCSELKAREKEEQRRIREQMREEEKARREYERAQKEAQKEEAMLRKAMEKAQAALEKATAEQRANYESQLADLQQKLTEAEEKNQRALSMAQQTRHGHVYVISNIGSFGENVYKVGMTRRLEPMDRVKELGDASVPFPFDVHAIIESDDAPALETELHRQLALAQVNKVNPRKEFFRVPISDIKDIVESRGLSTVWTMTAEAAEYKETLAIEETLKNDANARERWEHQMANVRVADVSDQDSEE